MADQRVALYLQDAHDLRDGLEYARYAESKGFEAVCRRDRARAEMPSFPLGPMRRKPLLAMRESVALLRRLLNMERVTFPREFHHVDGIELDVVHGRREPRIVPIYIGATGLKMMELAGEIADGVVLNYCVPPEYNDQAMQALEVGAKRVGRKVDDIDRPQLVGCSVDRDRAKALDASRALLTQYLAQQPHIAKASGVPQRVVDEIQQILGWPATYEQIQRAKHLVPEDLILRITASGTPEEALTKVNEYRRRGATCPILFAVGSDVRLLIDPFGPP